MIKFDDIKDKKRNINFKLFKYILNFLQLFFILIIFKLYL